MKKFLIILIAVVVFFFLLVKGVLLLTSGIVEKTDQLFRFIKDNQIQEAYDQCTSEEFRKATSLESFKVFLEASALIHFKEAKWNSRSIENREGHLEGSVVTKDGGNIPIEVSLVKEKGQWKIHAIRKAASGLSEPGGKKEIPDDMKLRELTVQAFGAFASAVNGKDFTDFHNGISKLWQAQITPLELNQVFKVFIEKEIDLTLLKDYEPVFSEKPMMDKDEFLRLEGYFPTKPSMVFFNLSFVYEHPSWELSGINVNIK